MKIGPLTQSLGGGWQSGEGRDVRDQKEKQADKRAGTHGRDSLGSWEASGSHESEDSSKKAPLIMRGVSSLAEQEGEKPDS